MTLILTWTFIDRLLCFGRGGGCGVREDVRVGVGRYHFVFEEHLWIDLFANDVVWMRVVLVVGWSVDAAAKER